jgi:hypothetical protein
MTNKKNYKNYSLLKEIRKRNDYNDQVENFLNNITLEDLISVKLELINKTAGIMFYGIPLYKNLKFIVYECLLKYSISVSETKKQAASLIGLAVTNFDQAIKKYKISELLVEQSLEKESNSQEDIVKNTYEK